MAKTILVLTIFNLLKLRLQKASVTRSVRKIIVTATLAYEAARKTNV